MLTNEVYELEQPTVHGEQKQIVKRILTLFRQIPML